LSSFLRSTRVALKAAGLGPSVFGAIWPEAQRAVFTANPQQQSMIDAVSQLGILMLLLLTGMETDLRLVKKARRAGGAEVALALARAGTSAVTAPYVMGTVGLGAAQRRLRRPTMSRRHEETILKDIVELADRYDTPIRTALRLDIAPEDAILRQARLGRYDLVVMGVGRPAGETLYFGRIAAAVLENSQHSILFVSS